MANNKPHTEKGKAAISHGLKRFYDRRRKLSRILPRALRSLVEGRAKNEVAPALRPFLEDALERAELLEALLGSPNAAQRELLGHWVLRVTAADGAYAEFLRGGAPAMLDRASAHASAAERLLARLGLTAEIDEGEGARREYAAAMRSRSDRGSARVMTGAPSPGGEIRPAVLDLAPGASRSEASATPAAPRASGANGRRP